MSVWVYIYHMSISHHMSMYIYIYIYIYIYVNNIYILYIYMFALISFLFFLGPILSIFILIYKSSIKYFVYLKLTYFVFTVFPNFPVMGLLWFCFSCCSYPSQIHICLWVCIYIYKHTDEKWKIPKSFCAKYSYRLYNIYIYIYIY